MAQNWMIINLDKLERMDGCWGKLGDWIFSSITHGLVPALVNTPVNDFFLPVSTLQMTTSVLCDLGHLPSELIDLIFRHVDNNVDIICLGLTCQFMWDFCRERMQSRTINSVNECSWAGDRLICVGADAETGDEPEGVLTKTEQESLKQSNNTLYTQDYAGKPSFDFRNSFRSPAIESGRLSRMESTFFDCLTCNQTFGAMPEEPVVLRNLSRHEYVGEGAVHELDNAAGDYVWKDELYAFNKRLGAARLSFGTIVALHICWSSDHFVSMRSEGGIRRGKWAGDRFDITPADLVQDAGVWKDVSGEVIEMVETIWGARIPKELGINS